MGCSVAGEGGSMELMPSRPAWPWGLGGGQGMGPFCDPLASPAPALAPEVLCRLSISGFQASSDSDGRITSCLTPVLGGRKWQAEGVPFSGMTSQLQIGQMTCLK